MFPDIYKFYSLTSAFKALLKAHSWEKNKKVKIIECPK